MKESYFIKKQTDKSMLLFRVYSDEDLIYSEECWIRKSKAKIDSNRHLKIKDSDFINLKWKTDQAI